MIVLFAICAPAPAGQHHPASFAEHVNDYTALTDAALFAMLPQTEHRDRAFGELYRRYSSRVYAYCLRVLGEREAASDAFQDTFTRFFHSARVDREMTNLPAFLLRIARNVCLNEKRAKIAPVAIDDIEIPSYDTPYERTELLHLISTALELLPMQYREAFVLREYDGMAYAEIASIVGISEETARIRVFRARDKVRKILKPYLVDLANERP